jgi:hypothetical protein
MLRLVALGTVIVAAVPVHAQVLASEHGVVAQTIDGATITVEYYRPVARGRTIFGKVVRWGETWTPGANWATTLETDRNLLVEGRPLAKGKYSLWMKVGRDEWTVLFSRTARRFHESIPDSADIVLRIPVRPQQTESAEDVLTWSFPVVRRDTTTLRFQWATTAVALQLAVEPTPIARLSPAAAAVYAGSYRLRFTGDTVTYGFTVYATPDGLQARMDTTAMPPDVDPRMDLLPSGTPHRFLEGDYQHGQFVGVEPNAVWVFTVMHGRATAVEGRSLVDNTVFARGRREP